MAFTRKKTEDSSHHLDSLGHSPPPQALRHFPPHSAELFLSKGGTKLEFLETINPVSIVLTYVR